MENVCSKRVWRELRDARQLALNWFLEILGGITVPRPVLQEYKFVVSYRLNEPISGISCWCGAHPSAARASRERRDAPLKNGTTRLDVIDSLVSQRGNCISSTFVITWSLSTAATFPTENVASACTRKKDLPLNNHATLLLGITEGKHRISHQVSILSPSWNLNSTQFW